MVTDVESKALAWPDQANALRIIDTPTFQAAGTMLVDIRSLRSEVDAAFDPTIRAAHNAHKTAVGAKKKVEAPLAEAEVTIKRMMSVYQTEQERRQREAQAQLDAELRRIEEEKRLAAAEKMEKAGLPEVAESLLAAPVVVAPVKVAPIAKADGVSFREVWHAEVVDLPALVAHCAANPALIPLYLVPNMTALNMQVKQQKAALAIPGVKAVSEKTVSATAKEPW